MQLFQDAAVYMREHRHEFDVIIVDSSDPVGPAETLYTSDFYSNMHSALRDGGIVCTQVRTAAKRCANARHAHSHATVHASPRVFLLQGECMWLHMDLIKRVLTDAKALYPTVDYGYSCVPTYPCGQIGFIIACKDAGESRDALRVEICSLAVRTRPNCDACSPGPAHRQARGAGGDACTAPVLHAHDAPCGVCAAALCGCGSRWRARAFQFVVLPGASFTFRLEPACNSTCASLRPHLQPRRGAGCSRMTLQLERG